jgi:hypothetical protein
MAINARAMAAGDFNGDRCADLVLCLDEELRLVFGGSAEQQWRAQPSPVTTKLAEKVSELAVADLNHDGKADLVTADHDSYAVGVLIGGGDGTFKRAPGSPFVARDGKQPHTHGLVVVDMNGDTHADVVTANNSDGDVSVLLGDGTGALARAAGSPFPCGPSPYPIAAGDISGDGHADIVVPNSQPGARMLHVLFGDGRGGLAMAPDAPLVITTTVRWASCGDLNGDGMTDVVASHDDDPKDGRALTVLLNSAQGKLTPSPQSPLPIGSFAWGVEIVDMNRDGRADLIVGANTGIQVLLGDGTGKFAPAAGSPFATGKGAWRVTVADFNGDGKPDVATRCIDAKRLEVLFGN